MSRILPNKCFKTRAEIEGRAYRMISFFHASPSEIPEDQWVVFRQEASIFLVDKVSFALMAECQCEFLTREQDKESAEPTIVSVKMDVKEAPIEETAAEVEETAAEVEETAAEVEETEAEKVDETAAEVEETEAEKVDETLQSKVVEGISKIHIKN